MSGEFLRGQTKDCLNLYSSFLICNFGEATYSVELSVIFSDKAFGVTPIEHHVLKAETPPRRLLGLIWSSPIPALKNAYSAAGSLGLLLRRLCTTRKRIMKPLSACRRLASYGQLLLPLASAFSFSYSAPRSCDPLEVQWNGTT